MGSESGASVRGETKKVITFIGLGIVAALAVGLLVWQFNTPFSNSSAESGYDTTNGHLTAASEEVRDEDEPAEAESGADTEGGQTAHAEAEHQPVAPANDPLLPPHAVSPDRGAQAAVPTRYYRPTNVEEPTRAPQSGPVGTVAEPTPSTATSTPQSTPSSPSTSLNPGSGQDQGDMGIHRTEQPAEPTGETSGPGDMPDPVPSWSAPTEGLDSMEFPRIDEWSLPPQR